MLQHYIKIAVRHLLKYKVQNLISIIGLSVGILCFGICLYCSRFIGEVDHCMGITIVTSLTVLFRILKIARTNPAEVIKNE